MKGFASLVSLLSLLAMGALNETIAAPTVASSQSGYPDGSSNAPEGTPQLANLLNGYSVRPPWKVAGVDYSVGVPAGTALKDPTIAANLPAGVVVDMTHHMIIVTANNVTLNGFDFSLHGGWGLAIGAYGAVSGTVVENCNFAQGSNTGVQTIWIFEGSSNTMIQYCSFNDNGSNNGGNALNGSILFSQGTGNLTLLFNYFYNSYGHLVDFVGGSSPITCTPIVKYNVFEGYGMGVGSHGNPWYMNGNNTIQNGRFDFNLVVQPSGVKGGNPALALPGGRRASQLLIQRLTTMLLFKCPVREVVSAISSPREGPDPPTTPFETTTMTRPARSGFFMAAVLTERRLKTTLT